MSKSDGVSISKTVAVETGGMIGVRPASSQSLQARSLSEPGDEILSRASAGEKPTQSEEKRLLVTTTPSLSKAEAIRDKRAIESRGIEAAPVYKTFLSL